MNLLAIVLASLCAQETKTVVRQEKNDYNPAVAKCREGEAAIDSDPQAAVERLTEVIGMPKVRLFECILRIEQRPGEFSDPYPFLPYQYRGKAKMNLSKRASSAEAAQKLVASALEDFQESAKRNVPSSAELAQTTKELLAKMKADVTQPPDPVKSDPVVKFREKWDPLMRASRFKAAKTLIDKEGDGLNDEQRKGFLQSTEQSCRALLTNWVADFRPRFVAAMSLGLDQKTSEEFDLLFSLPAPDELIVSHPAVEWVRQYLPAFRAVQSRTAPAHSLADAAAAAVPLEDRLENPWLKAVEAAVFAGYRDAITAEVDRARDAAKADRDKARAQADSLLGQWKAFTGKLDARILERHRFLADHGTSLAKLFDGFPTDLADLTKVGERVDAAFGAESPEIEMAKIEESLTGLESKGNLALESRQRLFTLHVTVAALRGLFAGKTEEAMAAELAPYRQKLREAGGPEDSKKYGPRVERIFGALR